MFKSFLVSFISLICVLSFSFPAYADRRSYVWTYEYLTMPKDTTEIEYYSTLEIPDLGDTDVNTWKHWLEFEYGLTNRSDIALYLTWKDANTKSSSNTEFTGFKLRGRYRFGEKGKFFVDPLLYLEYIRDDNLSKPNVIETKLILAKDLGNFNISYNQILKRNLEREGITEHEYALGINYALNPQFSVGIETKGNYSSDRYYLGPTFSFATRKFWVSLGNVFALHKRADDIQTRLIVGIPF